MISQISSKLANILGYEDQVPDAGSIHGVTLYWTLRFNLIHFLNFPFRFHKCLKCGKKFLCHNLSLRHGKGRVHGGCTDHWLDIIDLKSDKPMSRHGVNQD